MDEAVAVAVDAPVLRRVVLRQVREELVADVEPEGCVPVVLEGEWSLERRGQAVLAGVHHEQCPEDHHDCESSRE
ncbi:MAG: hypothetical protein ACLGIZ_16235 [Acidimicrobiia bacterium]